MGLKILPSLNSDVYLQAAALSVWQARELVWTDGVDHGTHEKALKALWDLCDQGFDFEPEELAIVIRDRPDERGPTRCRYYYYDYDGGILVLRKVGMPMLRRDQAGGSALNGDWLVPVLVALILVLILALGMGAVQ